MKSTYLLLLLSLTFTVLVAQPQKGSPLFLGKNYIIYPGNMTQTEVFMARSPLDHNTIFTTCNTISFVPFFISEGIFVTSDGGATWRGDDTCTGSPVGFHGGDPGIAIDKDGTFILTRMGRSPFVGLYSHYSLDKGVTWSAQQVISTDDLERAALATDAGHGSTWFGRTYGVWTKLSQPFPLLFSYTDDGAKTWHAEQQVNHPSARSAGGAVVVGLNGSVYTCWAGVAEISPFKEIQVGFASSSNGGADWNVTENAFPVNGITGVLTGKSNIRVNGLPLIAIDTTNGAHRGWIYIITGQKDLPPAGSDPDIILYRSTDGGVSWSSGIRVNQDPLNNGKTQYFPNLHIDKYGAIDVIFYDDRTTTNDSTGVFLARSTNGGDTWKEWEISDHHFKPAPIGGLGQGYQGDAIGLTSTDTRLLPAWMDNSSGLYQVWTVPINLTDINGIENDDRLPGSSFLQQNKPNPFHDRTTIPYKVKEKGYVSMRILDLFGNIIAEPVHEVQIPGDYEAVLDLSASITGSGVLFCRLVQGKGVETMKMVVVK